MTEQKPINRVKQPEALFGRVVSILDAARGNVVRAVNTQMVLAYWLIGREIVQELQRGRGAGDLRQTGHVGLVETTGTAVRGRFFRTQSPELHGGGGVCRRQCLSCGLRSAIFQCGVCAALLSKEVTQWHTHGKDRH